MELSDFLSLRKDLPVADVRSEGEYAEGHIRGALNIPILNNDERKVVGTDYKKEGQQSAIMTGFRLIGPRLANILEDAERVATGNEMLVHCWRGGMRSNYFCQFVAMARIKAHPLNGGYKSYRQKALESFQAPLRLTIIGGSTGSGKSEILRALKAKGEQVIDLEALANHKGSVFGGLMMPPQPTTEQFQNELFEEILKLDLQRPVWIEDESLSIGRIFLPGEFWKQMCQSPLVEIEVSRERRIQRLVEEYGPADRQQFLEAMEKITKRLGGQHFKAAREKLLAGDMAGTIEILLGYYDKAYGYGLESKAGRIVGKFEWDGRDGGDFADHFLKHIGHREKK